MPNNDVHLLYILIVIYTVYYIIIVIYIYIYTNNSDIYCILINSDCQIAVHCCSLFRCSATPRSKWHDQRISGMDTSMSSDEESGAEAGHGRSKLAMEHPHVDIKWYKHGMQVLSLFYPFLGICIAVRLCKRWSFSNPKYRGIPIWIDLESGFRDKHQPEESLSTDQNSPRSHFSNVQQGEIHLDMDQFLMGWGKRICRIPRFTTKIKCLPVENSLPNLEMLIPPKWPQWNKMMKPWILGPPFVSHGDKANASRAGGTIEVSSQLAYIQMCKNGINTWNKAIDPQKRKMLE